MQGLSFLASLSDMCLLYEDYAGDNFAEKGREMQKIFALKAIIERFLLNFRQEKSPESKRLRA